MYFSFGSSFVLTFLFSMWPSVTLLFCHLTIRVFEYGVCLILYIFSSTDDHSRVVLTAKRDIPGSDYINANYVDVRKLVFWSIWFTLILIAIFFLKSRTERYPGSYRFYFIIWCDWSRELALPSQPIKCAASTVCDLVICVLRTSFRFASYQFLMGSLWCFPFFWWCCSVIYSSFKGISF